MTVVYCLLLYLFIYAFNTSFLTISLSFSVSVKLIGKLQDGTAFLSKGHDGEEKLFEFKTDEGNLKSASVLSPLHPLYIIFFWSVK